MELEFTVLGRTERLERARTTVIGGYPHTYDTRRNVNNKALIYTVALEECKKRGLELPLKGALECTIISHVKIPSSFSKKKREECNVSLFPHGTPDVDNTAKLYLDALKGIIEDDRYIRSLKVEKIYDEKEYTECKIRGLEQEEENDKFSCGVER